MNARQYQKSLHLLEKAEKLNPKNLLTTSFKGLALKLMGENFKAKEVLKKVIENSTEEEAINLAKALLKELS